MHWWLLIYEFSKKEAQNGIICTSSTEEKKKKSCYSSKFDVFFLEKKKKEKKQRKRRNLEKAYERTLKIIQKSRKPAYFSRGIKKSFFFLFFFLRVVCSLRSDVTKLSPCLHKETIASGAEMFLSLNQWQKAEINVVPSAKKYEFLSTTVAKQEQRW